MRLLACSVCKQRCGSLSSCVFSFGAFFLRLTGVAWEFILQKKSESGVEVFTEFMDPLTM